MLNSVSVTTSVAELANGEKSRTQSLTHSPGLFDGPGTEAFHSEIQRHSTSIRIQDSGRQAIDNGNLFILIYNAILPGRRQGERQ